MNEYIRIRSSQGWIDIEIKTNDNAINIKGELRSQDPAKDDVKINRSVLLDDPERDTKVSDIWNSFKKEASELMTFVVTGIEEAYANFVSNRN